MVNVRYKTFSIYSEWMLWFIFVCTSHLAILFWLGVFLVPITIACLENVVQITNNFNSTHAKKKQSHERAHRNYLRCINCAQSVPFARAGSPIIHWHTEPKTNEMHRCLCVRYLYTLTIKSVWLHLPKSSVPLVRCAHEACWNALSHLCARKCAWEWERERERNVFVCNLPRFPSTHISIISVLSTFAVVLCRCLLSSRDLLLALPHF